MKRYVNNSSIAATKDHDQGNFKKNEFIRIYNGNKVGNKTFTTGNFVIKSSIWCQEQEAECLCLELQAGSRVNLEWLVFKLSKPTFTDMHPSTRNQLDIKSSNNDK